MIDLTHQYIFLYLIHIPTRTTNTTQTCIDHILSYSGLEILQCGTLLKDISDHFPIFAQFKISKNTPDGKDKRSFKRYLVENVDKLFGQVDWNEKVFSITEVDIAYDRVVTI